jgi:hypothetical protein
MLLTAAARGRFRRRDRGPDSPPATPPTGASEGAEVPLVGRVHPARLPVDKGVCSVVGCGAPAVLVLDRRDGTTVAFCLRCAEELDAILANGSRPGPAPG